MTVSRVPNVEGGIQPTIVTAKGDLIAAVANANPARLGVGSDGQLLTADSTSATGLSYQNNFAAAKNKIINADFRINQRAFTSTTTSGTYGFDRFWLQRGSGGTVTYSAQTFTVGTAPVVGYEAINFARIVTASQSATTDYAVLRQSIEDVRTFAGQTVTVSAWIKAGTAGQLANFGLAQNFGGGGSGEVYTKGANLTLTTSWARYSTTFTVPSIAGKTIAANSSLNADIWTSGGSAISAYTGIGNQNATIDMWGVQVEAGSTATAFQTATGTIQGELAACQRYYYRTTTGAGAFRASGMNITTAIADVCIPLQTTMRVAPGSIEVTGTAADYEIRHQNTFTTCSAVPTLLESAWNSVTIRMTVASGLTVGQACQGRTTTNGYIGWSAEL